MRKTTIAWIVELVEINRKQTFEAARRRKRRRIDGRRAWARDAARPMQMSRRLQRQTIYSRHE